MRRPLPALVLAALVAAGLGLAAPSPATSTAPEVEDLVSLVEVHTDSRAERQLIADLGLDLTEHGGADHVGVVLHGAEDAQLLLDHGFTWTVVIPDLVAREAERVRLDAAYAASADSVPMPSGRKAYRDLDVYEWELRELAKRNPGIVKLFALPNKTLEGRTVLGIEISDNVAATDGKPVFAVMGVHHAREWPSGEHTMEFAFDLVQRYNAGDPRTRDLLQRARVVAVPVVNPDGFVASRAGAGIVDGNELQEVEGARGDNSFTYLGAQAAAFPAYKRKNCRTVDGAPTPPGACTAPGARHLGVDPNRNYGALWGGAGASALPDDDTYRGPAPFSEPETQNIKHLVSTRQVTVLVTNHTFGGLVLRAPGVQAHGVTADEPAMKALGDAMAAANGSLSQAGFQLYDTTGTTEDWSYSATGGYGYTYELPVLEFHPPYAETVAAYLGSGPLAGKGTRESLYLALTAAADPAHHSVIAVDAPAGAVLRLKKQFETSTSPVRMAETQFTDDPGTAGEAQTFTDTLETVVHSGGHVEWHVNPSTRPAVMERKVLDVAETPSRTAETAGTAKPTGEHIDVPFSITAADASKRLVVDLEWEAVQDDLDLELYHRQGGTLVEVGSSGAPLNVSEHIELDDPAVGEYVMRVLSYQSSETPFTLTAATHQQAVTDVHPAMAPYETWTLTCERPDGQVLETVNVLVSRGDRVVFDLATCRRAWAA